MHADQSADLDLLYHDGMSAFEREDYEMAEARFRDALNLFPKSAILHNKLGQTLFEQDRPLEAVAAYKRAIALNPDAPEIHFDLGFTYLEQKRFESAAQARSKAPGGWRSSRGWRSPR